MISLLVNYYPIIAIITFLLLQASQAFDLRRFGPLARGVVISRYCTSSGRLLLDHGRASLDIIKSGGYKISALDIERELLSLPYISEAMVVGVADLEFGQRVAALTNLRGDQNTYSSGSGGRQLTIDNLRKGLRSRLAGYKMPTILRILDGELPKGQSGKVQKEASWARDVSLPWLGNTSQRASVDKSV